jgi:hypothetical protein
MFFITNQLDRIASGVEKVSPKLALAIDQISDEIDRSAGLDEELAAKPLDPRFLKDLEWDLEYIYKKTADSLEHICKKSDVQADLKNMGSKFLVNKDVLTIEFDMSKFKNFTDQDKKDVRYRSYTERDSYGDRRSSLVSEYIKIEIKSQHHGTYTINRVIQPYIDDLISDFKTVVGPHESEWGGRYYEFLQKIVKGSIERSDASKALGK